MHVHEFDATELFTSNSSLRPTYLCVYGVFVYNSEERPQTHHNKELLKSLGYVRIF
jgi:hypothetical protein